MYNKIQFHFLLNSIVANIKRIVKIMRKIAKKMSQRIRVLKY